MWFVAGTLAAAAGLMTAGCAAPEGGAKAGAPAAPAAAAPAKPLKPAEAQEVLNGAYAAFERKQYDAAVTGAERLLAANPQGPGAAEAHYLRGRVLEERAAEASRAQNNAAAKQMLQAAPRRVHRRPRGQARAGPGGQPPRRRRQRRLLPGELRRRRPRSGRRRTRRSPTRPASRGCCTAPA
jgi:hypothetical protein